MTIDEKTRERRSGAAEFSEDALGFGAAEWRTLRDLTLRPRVVLAAHETGGRTGGGLYVAPLKMYLLLNGVMMLLVFLSGGMGEQILAAQDPAMFTPMAERAGKSMDAFMADFDNWVSFAVVPVGSILYAAPIILLMRLWTKDSWRQLLRSAFTLLNVWTVPLVPLTPLLGSSRYAGVMFGLLVGLLGVAFFRLGHGRWFRGPVGGVLKYLALLAIFLVFLMLAGWVIVSIGVAGATFGP